MATDNIDWCKPIVIVFAIIIIVLFWGSVWFFFDKYGVIDAVYSSLSYYFLGRYF